MSDLSLMISMSDIPIITVAELNAKAKFALEAQLSHVAVSGEISNLVHASSGHFYFTLKDNKAQVRCAFFMTVQRQSAIALKNGQEVVAYGKISLYEPRGDYQLIVSRIQDTGLGLLYQQFIALKNKLGQMGLFDESRKKPIPKFPKHIGIITSPKGAALHDIQSTLQRRYPLAKTTLFPSEVQGALAHLQLIDAIDKAQSDASIDCIILARGGGSIEDLWAFNHEDLALKIANCKTPIISGIGHETDFTIADFVADQRAATPTAAAEKATPNQKDLLLQLQQWRSRLVLLMQNCMQRKKMQLKWCQSHLGSPEKILLQPWQQLDYATRLLKDKSQQILLKKLHLQALLHQRLEVQKPLNRLILQQEKLQNLQKGIVQNTNRQLEKKQVTLHQFQQKLMTLSPYATLQRGYAIATLKNKVLTNANAASLGDEIHLTLAQGEIISITKEIIDGKSR